MNCTATNLGSAVLVVASGRIDLETAEAFKNELSTALAAAERALVIDLSGVDYISSAGLRSLMIVFKAGKAAGKSFAIAGLQPLLMEIFTISRFNLVFPLFDRPRDAIEKLVPEALPQFDAH
jgi:anti-sigma B factor antagonist/stage II sporulation protein AA (anti-sigma F factor antagonist)